MRILNGALTAVAASALLGLPGRAESGGKAAGEPAPEAAVVTLNGQPRPDLPSRLTRRPAGVSGTSGICGPTPPRGSRRMLRRRTCVGKAGGPRGQMAERSVRPSPDGPTRVSVPGPVRDRGGGRGQLCRHRHSHGALGILVRQRRLAPDREREYGPGTKEFSGTAAIDHAQVNGLWIRLRQGADDANAVAGGSVVFQKFSFAVGGPAAAPDSPQIALVVPDQPLSVPGGDGLYRADLTQMAAAERLRMLIGRATGVWPRIVPAARTPKSGMRVFVGYGPHLKGRCEPPDRPEGLKILERDGDVYLLGEIAPAGTNNWPTAADRGVMHAVETFAERVMGYRFLYSPPNDPELFELGTAIPVLDTLAIERGLSIEEAPAFEHRIPYGTASLGLRSGSSPAFNCNHSYYVEGWAAMYAEKHPEMFIPKVPEGAEKLDDAQVAAMGRSVI